MNSLRGGGGGRKRPNISLAGHTLIHRKRVWYFTVSSFVLLGQLSQAAVGVLSIFIVHGLLEINARAIYSGRPFCNGELVH